VQGVALSIPQQSHPHLSSQSLSLLRSPWDDRLRLEKQIAQASDNQYDLEIEQLNAKIDEVLDCPVGWLAGWLRPYR